MDKNKQETLERWLFNFAEPPFTQTYEILADQYRQNLIELHRAESPCDWTVEDLIATPSEIRETVAERLAWLNR